MSGQWKDNPKDDGSRIGRGGSSYRSASDRVFSAGHINNLLSGNNWSKTKFSADKIIKNLKQELDELSPADRRKVISKIKTAEHKRNQGNSKKK